MKTFTQFLESVVSEFKNEKGLPAKQHNNWVNEKQHYKPGVNHTTLHEIHTNHFEVTHPERGHIGSIRGEEQSLLGYSNKSGAKFTKPKLVWAAHNVSGKKLDYSKTKQEAVGSLIRL